MDKIQTIEKLFYYIVTFSYLLLPTTWLLYRDKSRPSPHIGIYGLVVFILLKVVFDNLPIKYQLVYLDLYTLLEYLFFTYLLVINIQSSKLRRLPHIGSIMFVGFLVFQIVSQAFFDGKMQRLDSMSVGIETILLFVYIFLFFYDHSRNIRMGYIYNHYAFWVSVGILIYLGGSLFFNILANVMTSHEFYSYWHYTYIAEILKNVLFSFAMVMIFRQHKNKPANSTHLPYLDMDMN